jgi:hypothetical protein
MSDISIVSTKPVVAEIGPVSYMDWGAVVAGALVGIAVIATLTAFGSAVGLSLTSPYLGRGFSAYGTAVAIAIWAMWVVISGDIAAGYLAGRLRHASVESSRDEAELRNGAHGLVAWALTTIVVALLTAFAVFGGAKAVSSNAPQTADHAQYVADQLLRGERLEPPYDQGRHREVASVLRTASLPGGVNADDKAYLVRIVTARGADNAEAERQVDAAIADVKAEADALRKGGVLIGFLTAASLAIGAAAAWWAAKAGGAHRLDYRGISALTRWK